MAFTLFDFTKSWRNAGDFPTFEPDEAKVRDDMQSLFDELKVGLNRLIGELRADNMPFTPTAEVDSSDVQNAIENVQSQIASAVLGELPDGSVTAQKLSDGAVETDKIGDGAVTAAKIAEGVIPEGGENAPLMDGAASAGESDAFARADHVHPKDSSKADLSGGKVLPAQLTRARVNVTASRSLALSDDGKALYVSSSSAVTITIPLNSAAQLPVGSEIAVYRAGSGTVSIAAASGVTLYCADALNALRRYGTARLKKWDTNAWTVEIDHAVASGSITDIELANGAVTSDKIGSGAVTSAKIGSGAVTSAKISSNAVTRAKLAEDALYSPMKSVTTQAYSVVADDLGKTLRLSYNGAVSITLSNEVLSELPLGAEIAFMRGHISGSNKSFSITVGSNWYLERPGNLGSKGGTLTCSEAYELVAIKKVSGDEILATGNFD